jgi:hypothetical protein
MMGGGKAKLQLDDVVLGSSRKKIAGQTKEIVPNGKESK